MRINAAAGWVAKNFRVKCTKRRKLARSFSVASRLNWIAGLSRGSAERSFTVPWLSGWSSTLATEKKSPRRSRQPGNQTFASIATGLTSIWMSGRSSPSRVLMKPCAPTGSPAIVPVPNSFHFIHAIAIRSNRSSLSKVSTAASYSIAIEA